jgi:pSer/pThr/pTyr-binding forkhead associated (FHA) protein
MPDQQTVQVTPEEIIHLILEEMEEGTCPSFYSNLVPSIFDIYLYIDDLERLRPLESRMRDEAVRALNERVTELNKAGQPKLKLPLAATKRRGKRYETLGDWSIQFHENTEDDAHDVPLVIHSTFPVPSGSDDRVGTLTERVTRRRSDGDSTTTATLRTGNVDTTRSAGIVHATIEYEDDAGPHTFQMTKDSIKIGRGAGDRWVDVKLKTKKDVSREHAQIRRDPTSGRFHIKDLSTLGTTVNGRRLPASIDSSGAEDVDKDIEVPLPAKAKIGLAGVVFLEFRAVK